MCCFFLGFWLLPFFGGRVVCLGFFESWLKNVLKKEQCYLLGT